MASLRANKDPRSPDPGYIMYFYIDSHPQLGNEPLVADFNQVFSVPSAQYPELLHRKVLQMDDRSRVKFKIKLMTFFGRLTDEEHAAGLHNPWTAQPDPA